MGPAMIVKTYELDDPDLPVEAHKLRRVFGVYPRRRSTYDLARDQADKMRLRMRKERVAKQQTNLLELNK